MRAPTFPLIGYVALLVVLALPTNAGVTNQVNAPPFHHARFLDENGSTLTACGKTGLDLPASFSDKTGVGEIRDYATAPNCTASSFGASRYDTFLIELRISAPTGSDNLTVDFALNWTANASVTAGNCTRTAPAWRYYSCEDTAKWSLGARGYLLAADPKAAHPSIKESWSNASWLGPSNGTGWGVVCAKKLSCVSGGSTSLSRTFRGRVSLLWSIDANLNGSRRYLLVLTPYLDVYATAGEDNPANGAMTGLSASASLEATVHVKSITVT